jgi:hypothetical protein
LVGFAVFGGAVFGAWVVFGFTVFGAWVVFGFTVVGAWVVFTLNYLQYVYLHIFKMCNLFYCILPLAPWFPHALHSWP